MNGTPRVSVIIIFLNEERFLGEAIKSVRAQSYADWELLLVDDGSTDGSSEIARNAADGHQIRYVCHPGRENRGMSASRNAGIAASRGEFIAFIDADDIWLPSKLVDQIAIFDARPKADMIYGRTWIWHEWQSGSQTRDYYYDLGVTPGTVYPPLSLLPILIRNQAQTPTPQNAIMRRSLVERVGGFEDAFRGMFEDQVFFAKTHVVSHCHVDDRFWAKYRQHDTSHTAQSAGSLGELRARRIFLRWLSRYLKQQNVRNLPVSRALLHARLALWEQFARHYVRRMLGRA